MAEVKKQCYVTYARSMKNEETFYKNKFYGAVLPLSTPNDVIKNELKSKKTEIRKNC